MAEAFLIDWHAWWASVSPTFVFLFALPFAVAAAGWLAQRGRA